MSYDDAVLLEDPCPLREAESHLVSALLDTKRSPAKSRALRMEDLSRVGHLPLAQAAKWLGIAQTTVRTCVGHARAPDATKVLLTDGGSAFCVAAFSGNGGGLPPPCMKASNPPWDRRRPAPLRS